MKLTYMWYHYILYFLFGFLMYFELGMNQIAQMFMTLIGNLQLIYWNSKIKYVYDQILSCEAENFST